MKKLLFVLPISLLLITTSYMASKNLSNIQGTINQAFTGATTASNGASGGVPQPTSGQQTKFLRGDGTFAGIFLTGVGTPEGTTIGSIGDGYYDTSNNYIYVKETGNNTNTGWVLASASAGSVDYVNVYLNASTNILNNAPIVFTNVFSGNIPYNTTTGQFTLTAGKTYRLTSSVSMTTNASNMALTWFNVTAGAALGPSGMASSAGNPSTNQADVVFTPSVDTIVELRNTQGAARVAAGTAIGTASSVASHATIVQLGSTAITSTTLANAATQNTTWNSSSPIGSTAYVSVAPLATFTVGKTGSNVLINITTPPVSSTGTLAGDYVIGVNLDGGTNIPINSINQVGITNNGIGARLTGSWLFTNVSAGSHTINFVHKTTTSNTAGNTANLVGSVDRPMQYSIVEIPSSI